MQAHLGIGALTASWVISLFAVIGADQYLTRNIYWNPKVEVDNALAPVAWYYRVNSVFYDPSIYGRFLVVAIVAGLVLVLYGRSTIAWTALVVAAVTWIGLKQYRRRYQDVH